MSLIYDPSAIRYASTQEAYGGTWTFDKLENDGCQTWKNSQGQLAMVPKPVPVVAKHINKDPSWAFDGIDECVQLSQPQVNLGPYSQHDAEISEKLYKRQPSETRFGVFAGETYPKRKYCKKPKKGDRSVSQGEKYLYEYSDTE